MQSQSITKIDFNNLHKNIGKLVSIVGLIVIIDFDLYIIDIKYSEYTEFYKQSKKIKINNRDIAYVLKDHVLPYAGGDSFLFHESRINGVISMKNNEIEITPKSIILLNEEETISNSLVNIFISQDLINKSKLGKLEIFQEKKYDRNDWLSYYLPD